MNAVRPGHCRSAWRALAGAVPARACDRVVPDVQRLSCCREAPEVVWCQHHSGIFRAVDGGRSFEALGQGLPQEGACDLIYRHALDVDAIGTLLAIGSTTGNLWIGAARGERWRLVSAHLPPIAQVASA
jgi:hypothetical protein